MDKLQWFKFSYADWRMGKIQRCSEVTQARFMNLCCLYWSKEANLSYEDAEIEIDKEHLDVLIKKKIIERDNEHIFIKFLDEQLVGIAETSKGKSEAAKIRWAKYRKSKANAEQTNADAMHVHTDAMQKSAEKRREEERREDNIIKIEVYPTFDDFWELYDYKTGKNNAIKKWSNIKQSDKDLIMEYIPKYKLSNEKKYRKHPTTFLNNESWNDEIIFKVQDQKEIKRAQILSITKAITENSTKFLQNGQ